MCFLSRFIHTDVTFSIYLVSRMPMGTTQIDYGSVIFMSTYKFSVLHLVHFMSNF